MNIIEMACANVAGFAELYQRIEQKASLSGRSQSMIVNYTRYLAKAALHFNLLPTKVDPEQISAYLYQIQQGHNRGSKIRYGAFN